MARDEPRPHLRAALGVIAVTLLAPLAPGLGAQEAAPDVAAMAAELERMKGQLAELETLRDRVAELEQSLENVRQRRDEALSLEADDKRDTVALSVEGESGVETLEAAMQEGAPQGIEFGGALRFNYYWVDYDEAVKSKRGDSGLDLFRVGADGRVGNVLLSAEYRFYPFMDVLHHGWFGYDFGDSQMQLGVTRVPFGLLPYASHNFWFGTPYYLGMADDYDLGVKYITAFGPWEWQAAFFKNGELASSTDLNRYSYDVVAVGETRNEETNQFNLRGSYTFGANSACSHELGFSGEYGELYNADTDLTGDHWAVAGHLDTRCGRWNLQLQAAHYLYSPENPPGISDDVIRLGGFGTSYDVASEASVYVANVAYNLPIPWEQVDQVTCYNDFSIVVKDESGWDDSKLNTTGCLLGIGPLYVYVDLIQAENMVFFGNGSLAGNGQQDWDKRFNVNIGYYW